MGATAWTSSEWDSPGNITRTVAVNCRLMRCSVWLMPAERNSLSNDDFTAPAGVNLSGKRWQQCAKCGVIYYYRKNEKQLTPDIDETIERNKASQPELF